jgi:hypothetical protein
MANSTQITQPSVMLEPKQASRPWLFGSLALLGAGASLLFCYAQVVISLISYSFGLPEFELDIHVQALFMSAFALVTVIGLARDRNGHNSNVPLIMSACAVAIIIGTLYVLRRSHSHPGICASGNSGASQSP